MSDVGFCSACGIFREDDARGQNITDCVCTAKRKHEASCLYLKAVACPIDTGILCEHGIDVCEECDCDCPARKEKP